MKRKVGTALASVPVPEIVKRNLVAVHSHIYDIPIGHQEIAAELFKEITILRDLVDI